MSVVALHPPRTRSVHSAFAIDSFECECAGTPLDTLCPEEGRILALLATCGPQPAVDLRECTPGTGRQAITTLAREAGIVELTKVPVWLDHLRRLGLIELSPRPLPARRYEALDAEVDAPWTARRCSLRITPAGQRRHAQIRAAA